MGRQYAHAQVSTVFLGGGTPTLVPPKQLSGVLDALKSAFSILPDAEFSAEGNPGTLTEAWLDAAMARGLNRLSLGVQAAQNRLLKAIGRIHSFEDAQKAVSLARACGIQNLNLDAMFGLPGQTLEDYLHTLSAFDALHPQHISAYGLILEPNTPLEKLVTSGQVLLPSEDETAAMYEEGIAWLQGHGYERYEVSNFAKPGYACRHNVGYWQGAWYLGLGVAAHSMLPPKAEEQAKGAVRVRRSNTCDLSTYLKGDGIVADIAFIDPEEAMFETMMLGLRTTAGVSEKRFLAQHGIPLQTRFGAALHRLVWEGLGHWTDGAFALTPRGIEVQNEVLLRLMDEP